MQVTFYGVRGSTPTPGTSTVRYGGNTVSTEVRLADGSVIILDAGTGIRELGKALLKRPAEGSMSLLLSHVHWDHILGLPFFAPVWMRGTELSIYPVANDEQRVFARQLSMFDGVHFPVRASDLPAVLHLVDALDAEWRIGSAIVRRIALNHPGGAQGFRIDDSDGSSIVYLTDNELVHTSPNEKLLENLANFSRGVGLMIHDAQYLHSDMPLKLGWGHSLVDEVLELGRRSEAARLALFHHDPDRDDNALDVIAAHASAWCADRAPHTEALVAREGQTINVTAR